MCIRDSLCRLSQWVSSCWPILIYMFMSSKKLPHLKPLATICLPPAIFCIIEPIMFGLPVVCLLYTSDMAMRMKNDYHNFEWFVAESGMGVENEKQYKNESGMIQDDYRIEFISMHLDWLLRGVTEGSNCKGYMLWAFTDNVSPMNAFKNRYGLSLIHIWNCFIWTSISC